MQSILDIDPDWAFQRFCIESGFEVVDVLSLSDNHLKKSHLESTKSIKKISMDLKLTKFGSIDRGFLDQIELKAFGSIAVLVVLIGVLSFAGLTVFNQIQQVDFEVTDADNLFNANLDLDRKTGEANSSRNQFVGVPS